MDYIIDLRDSAQRECSKPLGAGGDLQLKTQLYTKAQKSVFHLSSTSNIKTVTNFSTPSSCKKVQRFLGYANLNQCFIEDYSTIAANFHALTSVKQPLSWS